MSQEERNINDSYIISYLTGDVLEPDQYRLVEDWMKNPENQRKARRIYQEWELSVIASPNDIDVSKEYRKLSNSLFKGEVVKDDNVKYSRNNSFIKWAVAASVVGLILFLGIYFNANQKNGVLLTTISKVNDFRLADESYVSLNDSSTLSFNDKDMASESIKKREVWLKGEGFFDVKSIKEKPFIVYTNDATITVLGTKFLVKEQKGLPTKVLVTEGRVEVFYRDKEQKVILQADEEVALVDEENKTEIQVSDSDNNQLYWKTGIMTFEEQSLAVVFETLSEEFNVAIVPENEGILACELTATFEKKSLETIMQVIGMTHGLKSDLATDTLIVSGNGCH